MGYAFSNKSHLMFGPGTENMSISGTGVKFTTPDEFRISLGDLARLQYLKGRVVASFRMDAGDGVMVAQLRLKNGDTVLGSASFNADNRSAFAGTYKLAFDVALSDVGGADQLYLELESTTAPAATRVGTLAALLEVESPLVVG